MMRLADLVENHEDWLMNKVLTYAKETGMNDYISKPVRMEDLAKVLANVGT